MPTPVLFVLRLIMLLPFAIDLTGIAGHDINWIKLALFAFLMAMIDSLLTGRPMALSDNRFGLVDPN